MNRSSRNTMDSKTNAKRKVTRTSNGGIAGPLPLPSLRMSSRICSFPPIILKRGDSTYTKQRLFDEPLKESFTVPSVDDTPQNHPSHVPTPTTLEGLCRDDVHEVIFDTIPTKIENFFSYTSQDPRSKCLGGSFWGESAVNNRRENSERNLSVSVNPVTEFIRTDIPATATALQRQWEVENTVNLHQVISSRRLLDKDLLSGNGWSLLESNE